MALRSSSNWHPKQQVQPQIKLSGIVCLIHTHMRRGWSHCVVISWLQWCNSIKTKRSDRQWWKKTVNLQQLSQVHTTCGAKWNQLQRKLGLLLLRTYNINSINMNQFIRIANIVVVCVTTIGGRKDVVIIRSIARFLTANMLLFIILLVKRTQKMFICKWVQMTFFSFSNHSSDQEQETDKSNSKKHSPSQPQICQIRHTTSFLSPS